MRLACLTLAQSRSPSCQFAQFLCVAAHDTVPPAPKRRCIQSCRQYSRGGKDAGGGRVSSLPGNSEGKPSPAVRDRLARLAPQVPPIQYMPLVNEALNPGPLPQEVPTTTSPVAGRLRLSSAQLEAESDVGHCRNLGSKLVDDRKLAHDFGLWTELLLHRRRHYGNRGVMTIWRGMRERCEVDLPASGEDAAFFWWAFVEVAWTNGNFMKELHDHAQDLWNKRQERWYEFYRAVVGGYLERGAVAKAVKWHMKLKDIHLPDPSDITRLLGHAILSDDGMKGFRSICRRTEGHKIYSRTMYFLWERERVDDAVTMHEFLVGRGDRPQTAKETEPLFRHLRAAPERMATLRKFIEMEGTGEDHGLAIHMAEESQEERSNPGGQRQEGGKDPPPIQISDNFAARLFATDAFSFQLVLAGLQMFSVEAIGPETLRQIALRAHDTHELAQHIKTFEYAGISIGDSVFAKVVRKLANQGDDRTLQALLESDQHTDVLEDAKTQEYLLASYTLSQDWRRARLTSTILSILLDEDPYDLNIRFRHALNTRQWSAIPELFEEMKENKVLLSPKSLGRLVRLSMPRRRRGRAPRLVHPLLSNLSKVIGTLQYVAENGGRVDLSLWIECLKRLGMAGRWSELETLTLWLAWFLQVPRTRLRDTSTFSEPGEGQLTQLVAAEARLALKRVFSRPFQRALVGWGFCTHPRSLKPRRPFLDTYSKDGERLIPWVRGVVLLRRLKDRGVMVNEGAIRQICRKRLQVLFGRYRLSARRRSRALRQENPYRLDELLAHIDKAWGDPLFAGFRGSRYELVNPRVRSPWPNLMPQNWRPIPPKEIIRPELPSNEEQEPS